MYIELSSEIKTITRKKEKKIMTNFTNLTPHAIALNDGRVFETSGVIARVTAGFTDITGDFCSQSFGEISGLPEPVEGVFIIVSGLVFDRTDRLDVVAPATGHPLCVRNDKGHIVSVPCFLRKGV